MSIDVDMDRVNVYIEHTSLSTDKAHERLAPSLPYPSEMTGVPATKALPPCASTSCTSTSVSARTWLFCLIGLLGWLVGYDHHTTNA